MQAAIRMKNRRSAGFLAIIDGCHSPDLPEYLDARLSPVLKKRSSLKQPAVTIMTDKDDILLNSREVAFLLDLSPDTVNEFARRNILPAFKKGRQWRFRKRDIASFKRHLRGVNVAA